MKIPKAKTLERAKCAVLPLILQEKWFAMVALGQKREEYLDHTRYWMLRIINWLKKAECLGFPQVVEFRLGYEDHAQRTAFLLDRLLIRAPYRFEHPDWGEPCGEHYVLGLGERVALKGVDSQNLYV